MKKTLLLTVAILLGFVNSYAWDSMGHATIAALAERHLSPAARKALDKYLGGQDIILISSDPDYLRGKWTTDVGFKPDNLSDSRPEWVREFDRSLPDNYAVFPHTFTVDENLEPYHGPNLDGKFICDAMWYIEKFAEQLTREAETMDAQERRIAITIVIHMVGDIHCPSHVTYGAFTDQPGAFTIDGKSYKFHSFWDSILSNGAPWSCCDLAEMLDNADRKEIAGITAGNPYEWAKACAQDCYEVSHIATDAAFPKSYIVEARQLGYSQARKAGYRLASILNRIFK